MEHDWKIAQQPSELGEGKPLTEQKPLLGGLHQKCQSGCSSVPGLCFLSPCQLFLHCPLTWISPAHNLVTTTTKKKKGIFSSWISFLLRSFQSHSLGHGREGDTKGGDASACPGTVTQKLTNPKYLLLLLVWVTVSKWCTRQTLPTSTFMPNLNSCTGKIYKWRSGFDSLFSQLPRMKNTAKCQLFLVKLAELQLLTV